VKHSREMMVGAAVGAGLGLFYVLTARYEQKVCLGIHTTSPGTETAADDACAKADPTGWSIAHNPVVALLTIAASAGVGAAVMRAGRR